MLVIAAPGQGAQTPGFLNPWLELPGFADRLGGWSELAGCDLIRCGTTADAEEIRDWVRQRLRGSKTPDDVYFRDDLPHTDTGKLLRRELIKDLA